MLDPIDLGTTWVEIEGKAYGAQPDERGPIGGGNGYQQVLSKGDYAVATLEELQSALKKARTGEVVFIEPTAEIDFTEWVYAETMQPPIDPEGKWALDISHASLVIPAGVTLASNRCAGESPGALLCSDAFHTRPLIRADGPGVRITGLRLRGPDSKQRQEHYRRSFKGGKGGHPYYYKFPISDGIATAHPHLEVDNCELSAWSHAGIFLKGGDRHHVHHCHIHHCQYNGLGYGVCLDTAFALIEANAFNFNRHSIAGTGRAGSGYEACHNVEMGSSLSHCFDMHGGSDRKDGTNIAADWLKIHHNTFRAPERAIAIRGLPPQGTEIYGNWFYQSSSKEAVTQREGQPKIYDNACLLDKPVLERT